MITEQYIGRVLDRRYRILEFIAEGGMSLLFRAVHVGTGRPLAVKILREKFRSSSYDVRRFQREAWLTAALKHENIVDIIDVQTEEDCYLVMELLVGVDLRTHLRRHGRLPWVEVRAISLQICGALQCAHDHGVVHRDLKPANCFRLEPSGQIKVLDLGIAKSMSPLLDGHGRLTMTGAMLGTPAYMAPEQYFGQADARTDVYSVGLLMFELLTGRHPFSGSEKDLLQQILNSPMPALASVAEHLDCPPGVNEVIGRALAKLSGDRHLSMRAFADAIAALDAETTTVVEPATPATVEPNDDFVDRPTLVVPRRVPVTPPAPSVKPLEEPTVAVVAEAQTLPAPCVEPLAEPTVAVVAEAQMPPVPSVESFEEPLVAVVAEAQTPPAPSVKPLEDPIVAVVAGAQTPPAAERAAPAMECSTAGPAAEETPVAGTDVPELPRSAAVEEPSAARAEGLVKKPAPVLLERPLGIVATPASGPDRRRAVGRIAVAALVCAAGLVLAWHPGGPTVASAGPEIAAGTSQSPTVERPGEVAAEEPKLPSILEQPKLSETPENTDAESPAPPATPATSAPGEAQTTPQLTQKPAPWPVNADKAAARARQKRQGRAEKAIMNVLIAERIGDLASQVKVSVLWTAAGEVTEATVDYLPREERTRVEARLRELPAPAGPSEPLSVEKTFELQLPE